jgi:uncharacterized repeat protein (TIGR03803 family)
VGSECGGNQGCGTIFELMPTVKGLWTETVLHTFCTTMNCPDGSFPTGALVFDSAGNLYGTTGFGGANGLGTVFELSPGGDGTWTETVLHSFQGGTMDGSIPIAPLVFDVAGNVYGTTTQGGSSSACGFGCGTVFELTPGSNGTWTEKILYSFCADGSCSTLVQPSSLTLDAAGNLYGTTNQGGANAYGTVFQLSPHADGTWKYKVLHNFMTALTDTIQGLA